MRMGEFGESICYLAFFSASFDFMEYRKGNNEKGILHRRRNIPGVVR
jgi:hypothetical protein